MIEVNLLQQEKKKAQPARRKAEVQKPLIFLGFAVVVGAVAAVDIKMYTDLKSVRSEHRRVERRLKDPEHVGGVQKAKELQADLDRLNRKKAIIVDLIENRIHWSKKLGVLRELIPSNVWIESIKLETPTNVKENPYQILHINAATTRYERSHAVVADTMERLGESEVFMTGLESLIDEQIRNEPWEKGNRDDVIDTRVSRFRLVARRPLPDTETE